MAERLVSGLEVQFGLELEQALAEAGRCFSCGTCTNCDNCFHYCPDLAIRRVEGGGYEVLTDYCKGCGMCVKECPTGSITMGKLTREKNLIDIMAAHQVPYAATATAAHLPDLVRKVEKAKAMRGFRIITILIPCIDGWGLPDDGGLKAARHAVESGAFPLYEVEDGRPLHDQPAKLHAAGERLPVSSAALPRAEPGAHRGAAVGAGGRLGAAAADGGARGSDRVEGAGSASSF